MCVFCAYLCIKIKQTYTMAEFCTKCAKEHFGDNVKPDIDVDQIFSELEAGTYVNVLCEGCVMVAIAKDQSNNLVIAREVDGETVWTTN